MNNPIPIHHYTANFHQNYFTINFLASLNYLSKINSNFKKLKGKEIMVIIMTIMAIIIIIIIIVTIVIIIV